MITFDDFVGINFGVFLYENVYCGRRFIYQIPTGIDKSRIAQNGRVLIIDGVPVQVVDEEEMLRIVNYEVEGSMKRLDKQPSLS